MHWHISLTPLIYFSLLCGGKVHILCLLYRHGSLPLAALKTQTLSDRRAGEYMQSCGVMQILTINSLALSISLQNNKSNMREHVVRQYIPFSLAFFHTSKSNLTY